MNASKLSEDISEECLQQIISSTKGMRHPIKIINHLGAVWAYDGDLVSKGHPTDDPR
jgi:hypothetical protein